MLEETFFGKFNDANTICFAVIWFAILIALYWIFYVPITWTRGISEVGYGVNSNLNGIKKKIEIDRLNGLRKIGQKLPPPYPNGWFRLIASKQLKPGKVMNYDCLGQNFVIFRSENGKVYVLDAYCPHLGANLGVGGKVRGDCIECPFHHWTFRGVDGTCKNIPYTANQTIPKSAFVKAWKSCEINDEIFVWHHVESEEPWTIPSIKEIENNDWTFYGENEFLVNCHIQDIPENGADIAHLNAVHHANIMLGSDLRKSDNKLGAFARHIWNANWQPITAASGTHISTINLTHSIRMFNKLEFCEMSINAEQIGPGYVILNIMSSYGKMVICQSVTPIEPLIQRVTHRFYGPRYHSIFGKFMILAESLMFERDMMMWNNKKYIDNPCLMKEDKFIKIYRQWFRQFYSNNSVAYSRINESNSSW